MTGHTFDYPGDYVDLDELAAVMRANSEIWFPAWHAPDAPLPLDVAYCMGMGGEAGEVLNALKKVYRDGRTPERLAALELELADVFTYLLLLAGELSIDILDAYRKKAAVLRDRHGA